MKQEQKNLVDYILDELKGLDITKLQLDPDFLKYLAELIENQVSKKSMESAESKPSKMDIMIEVIKRLFPHITETELANKLINKVPLSKIMKFYLKQKFFKAVKVFDGREQ
jgi:hypothetical protein